MKPISDNQKSFSFCDNCGAYLRPNEGVLNPDTGELRCLICASREIPQDTDDILREFSKKYHLEDTPENGDFTQKNRVNFL